jgi:transposase-like protein
MEKTKQEVGRKGQRSNSKRDVAFMRHVARTYIEGDWSLNQLVEIFNVPNQTINRWVLKYSDELAEDRTNPTMTEEEQKEVKALQKQVEGLKKKLEYEQMKNFALETMADLAKTELGIDIRKNSGAKQPKK